MGIVIAFIGDDDNAQAYDIRMDSAIDLTNIDLTKTPIGSTAYDMSTGDLYMLNTSKVWLKQ